jgi:hypothetical protein
MSVIETINVLNRLLAIEYRSLPNYLQHKGSWAQASDARAKDVFHDIVHSQAEISERIAQEVTERGGTPEPGGFPMEYTDLHFLSVDYLVTQLVDSQKKAIAAIQQCRDASGLDVAARAMVEEALGAEKAHLEALEELVSLHA